MKALVLSLAALAMAAGVACSPEPKTEVAKEQLHNDAKATINDFKAKDPSLDNVLNNAAGYAVFPSVGKAEIIAGGAYGHGDVYANGQRIGYCSISEGTVGAALGAESWSELIVFQTPDALRAFKSGNFTLDAQASAVALTAGAAGTAKFSKDGTAVFVMSRGGLNVNASIGGQKFSFTPIEQ